MSCYYVIGLRVNHRTGNALKLQQVLTAFGCHIKLRVGLHETDEAFCSDDGVILLQACGERAKIDELLQACGAVDGVRAQMMDLND